MTAELVLDPVSRVRANPAMGWPGKRSSSRCRSGVAMRRDAASPRPPSRRALAWLAGLATCVGLVAAEARGQTYEPNIPDFYQHQRWGANDDPAWEFQGGSFGGWCYQTAVVDGFYYWKTKDPTFNSILSNDITDPTKSLGAANAAIKGLATGGQSIQAYLKAQGIGSDAGVGKGLSVTNFRWGPYGNGYNAATGTYNAGPLASKIYYLSAAAPGGVASLPATTTFLDLYQKQINKGLQDTLILRTENPATVSANLWWQGVPDKNNGSFHAVAGAGYSAATSSIIFADPDTNKGSAAANGGINTAATVGGVRDDPAVDARKFKAGDPIPVPNPAPANGTNPNTLTSLYKTVSLGADGRTVQNVAANDPYQNVSIVQINTLAKNGAALVMAGPGAGSMVAAHLPGDTGPVGGSATPGLTVDLGSGSDASVSSFWIFPNAPIDTSATPYFDKSGWDYAFLSPGGSDIFGNQRPDGGVEITDVSGSAISPSDLAALSFSTDGTPTGFDVFFQNASDPTDYDVQVYGGPETFMPFQTAVPEPSTLVLAGIAGTLLAAHRVARRRARAARPRGTSRPTPATIPSPGKVA